MTEAASSSVTSIYVYIYQTVQNHTTYDIFLVIALRIPNITVLQHVRDYPLHTAFNILFLAAPDPEVTKLTEFSSQDSERISFPLPIYTFRPSFQMYKYWNYTLWRRVSYFKDIAKLENVWQAFKRYCIRIWTLNLITAPSQCGHRIFNSPLLETLTSTTLLPRHLCATLNTRQPGGWQVTCSVTAKGCNNQRRSGFAIATARSVPWVS
jgi:hypothetical protein